jgi:AcrR family transcriptional regulator
MAISKSSENLDEGAWVDAALDLLVRGSVDSVGIEPLAKILGVTKGSFYWHFKDRSALLRAMLRRWQQQATLSVIERLDHSQKTPAERLRQLFELPYSTPKGRRGGQVELAIRGWARRDDLAASAVSEVDQVRMKFSVALFRSNGFREEEARARAYMVYACQLAESLINCNETGEETKARRELCETFLLGAG